MDFFLPYMDGIAKIVDEQAELLDFFRVRGIVGAVHKGDFLPKEILRHRFIGDQHEILNHPGRHVPLIGLDFQRPPVPVQNDFRFWEIKINGAPFPSFFPQNGG